MKIFKILVYKILYPFKWILGKIFQGIKYVIVDNYNKVFLVILPNFFFTILGITIVIYGFRNIKEDTTNLTNYGFAILATISSICFSWSKGIDNKKEQYMVDKIIRYGESSLHCAIIFLLASALKYSSLHLTMLIPNSLTIIYLPLNYCLQFIYLTCFTLGFSKFSTVICDLNKLLYENCIKARNIMSLIVY